CGASKYGRSWTSVRLTPSNGATSNFPLTSLHGVKRLQRSSLPLSARRQAATTFIFATQCTASSGYKRSSLPLSARRQAATTFIFATQCTASSGYNVHLCHSVHGKPLIEFVELHVVNILSLSTGTQIYHLVIPMNSTAYSLDLNLTLLNNLNIHPYLCGTSFIRMFIEFFLFSDMMVESK
ncbi:hypothetical protein L9F63_002976, partial [Diploptera punctata]